METSRTTVRCPTCHAAVRWTDNPFRPFCSGRCRILDLGNWAGERYRVPGEPAAGEDDPEGSVH